MQKVLVTGATGQLGSKLMKLFRETPFQVHGTYNETKPDLEGNYHKMDLTLEDEISQTISKLQPDVIVHCGAMTNVDACEENPGLADIINHRATRIIVGLARESNCRLYYVSTDFIFDGEEGNYCEESTEKPIQTYGKTKLDGERAVLKMHEDRFCIIRTSVVFGSEKGNFVSWIIESLESGEGISIVENQWVTPTYSVDLAEKIIQLIVENRTGVWNISCSDKLSRLEMAYIISNTFGLGIYGIKAVKMDEMRWSAKRPVNSSLNTKKIGMIARTYTFEECLIRMKD